jgi:magnesium transporter
MIEVFSFSNGKINVSDNLNNLIGFTWIRCVNPTKSQLKQVTKSSGILEEGLFLSINEDERPRVSVKKCVEIIYRTPYVKKDDIITLPIYFYIHKNVVVTIEKRNDETFEKLSELMKDDGKKVVMKRRVGYFIYYVLDEINDRFLNHTDAIAERVDIIEDQRDISTKSVEKVYDSSVALSYFNQALLANIEVLNSLRKNHSVAFSASDREKFAEVYSDALYILDAARTQREIISNLFNLQSIISSNKLNEFMKRLASLAFVVMIPTLITGVYGMNFIHIPLREHPYGFIITVMFMIVISSLFTMFFIKIDWL